MTIKILWGLFCYGFKRDHYEKYIGIRKFLQQLSLDCFNNCFTTDSVTLAQNMPLLHEVGDGDIVLTGCSIHFPVRYLIPHMSEIFMKSLSTVHHHQTLLC